MPERTFEQNIDALLNDDASIGYKLDGTNEEVKKILEKIDPELSKAKLLNLKIDSGPIWKDEKLLFLLGDNISTRRYEIQNGEVTQSNFSCESFAESEEKEDLVNNLNTLLKHCGTVSTARKPGDLGRYVQDERYKLKEGQITYGDKKCVYEGGKLVGKTGLDKEIDKN